MTKRLILICACWTLLTLAGGLIGVWRIHTHPIEGVPSELRASKLGLSIGALTATGYAVFWLISALTARTRGTDRLTGKPKSQIGEIPETRGNGTSLGSERGGPF